MKKLLLIFTLIAGLASCKDSKTAENTVSADNDRVEILYFHGNQRCATCMAIEKYTKEVIEKDFADEIKDGNLLFKEIDISTPDGEAIADKYEVTWSSLFVNSWKEGRETRHNLTEFGFRTVKKNHMLFQDSLANVIRKSLEIIRP